MHVKIILGCVAVIACLVLLDFIRAEWQYNLLGDSFRLGNLIDCWFFGSLGSRERIRLHHGIKSIISNRSFGSTLNLSEKIKKHRVFQNDPEKIPILVNESEKFWALYSYSNIVLAFDALHELLLAKMIKYAGKNRPKLLELLNSTDEASPSLIIHYRMGDFVRLGQLIPIKAVVDACASLRIASLDKIGIMDGGSLHPGTTDEDRVETEKLRSELKAALKTQFPAAIIECTTGSDTDYDFYTCAGAKNLVTAGGSFAICAAIANRGNVRTPACINTNFPQNGQENSIREIRKNWQTYFY